MKGNEALAGLVFFMIAAKPVGSVFIFVPEIFWTLMKTPLTLWDFILCSW
jgi:hypothetical protein